MHKNEAAESGGKDRSSFTNREFVAMARAELAAMGRPDVTIERSWIDEDEPGCPFLLHVPVGTELTIPLKVMDAFLHDRTAEDRKRHAAELAKALVNLRSAEVTLVKYVRDVRKAANAAVAAARAEGLDVLLDRVGLKPTYAYHLTHKNWKDAAMHVLASLTFRHTSFYLRPGTSDVHVEEPGDVAEELKSILEDQRERQDRMAELEARAADLIVDQITLDLLAAHDLDAVELLTKVWKEQHVHVDLEDDVHATHLSLTTSNGRVTASIGLAQAQWNGEHLWFTGDEREKDHKALVGKSLGDLVPHPAFTSRPIASVDVRHIDHVSFDMSDTLLFDAETCRIWREESLAA